MANVKTVQQLNVTTEDKPGMLMEVTAAIAAGGVNIEAICAYGMEGKAIFYIVTSENAKAKQTLSSKGWQVKEEEVVLVDLENNPGALKELSLKLKSKNINLSYCYGSTCASKDCSCRLILKAENSKAIIETLS